MKAFPKLIVVAACTAVSLQAQTLRISDFRIPDSFFERLSVNVGGTLSSANSDWGASTSNSSSRRSSNFDFSQQYRLFQSNERSLHNLTLFLDGSLASNKSSELDVYANRLRKGSGASQSWSMYFDWDGSSYVNEELLYWYAAFEGNAHYSDQRDHYEVSDTAGIWSNDERWKNRSYDVRASAGWGIGKVRDGLPVFTILRIIDRLRKDNALLREPERDEILQLVQIYSRLSEYQGKHDRYAKNLFGDLFVSMESMGIVGRNGLAAYSIVHTMDVLSEYHSPRLFGWRIQAGLEHHSSQDESIYTAHSSRRKAGSDYLNLRGEIGHDFSLESHAYADMHLSAGLFTPYLRFMEFEAKGVLTYDLGERIETRATITYVRNHNWEYGGTLFDQFALRTNLSSTFDFRFFVEDRVTLRVGSTYNFSRSSRDSGALSNSEKRAYASIGLDYRFF